MMNGLVRTPHMNWSSGEMSGHRIASAAVFGALEVLCFSKNISLLTNVLEYL